MTDAVLTDRRVKSPPVFTREEIGWVPWLEPLALSDLTPRHWAGLVDEARSKSDYFMLLVRDPGVLEARTLTDKDIFYNSDGGLPRAERELAAARRIALQRLHLLRLGSRAVRFDLFEAARRH
jgi:hypothetical protein